MELRIQSLTKLYDHKRGLLPTSFDVKKSELVSIVGHNGAGKSTLLKMLEAGFYRTVGSCWLTESI